MRGPRVAPPTRLRTSMKSYLAFIRDGLVCLKMVQLEQMSEGWGS